MLYYVFIHSKKLFNLIVKMFQQEMCVELVTDLSAISRHIFRDCLLLHVLELCSCSSHLLEETLGYF